METGSILLPSDPEDPLDVSGDLNINISHTPILRPLFPGPMQNQAPGRARLQLSREEQQGQEARQQQNECRTCFHSRHGRKRGKVWFLCGVSEDMGLPSFPSFPQGSEHHQCEPYGILLLSQQLDSPFAFQGLLKYSGTSERE